MNSISFWTRVVHVFRSPPGAAPRVVRRAGATSCLVGLLALAIFAAAIGIAPVEYRREAIKLCSPAGIVGIAFLATGAPRLVLGKEPDAISSSVGRILLALGLGCVGIALVAIAAVFVGSWLD